MIVRRLSGCNCPFKNRLSAIPTPIQICPSNVPGMPGDCGSPVVMNPVDKLEPTNNTASKTNWLVWGLAGVGLFLFLK